MVMRFGVMALWYVVQRVRSNVHAVKNDRLTPRAYYACHVLRSASHIRELFDVCFTRCFFLRELRDAAAGVCSIRRTPDSADKRERENAAEPEPLVPASWRRQKPTACFRAESRRCFRERVEGQTNGGGENTLVQAAALARTVQNQAR